MIDENDYEINSLLQVEEAKHLQFYSSEINKIQKMVYSQRKY